MKSFEIYEFSPRTKMELIDYKVLLKKALNHASSYLGVFPLFATVKNYSAYVRTRNEIKMTRHF